jgi:hypothetical protein
VIEDGCSPLAPTLLLASRIEWRKNLSLELEQQLLLVQTSRYLPPLWERRVGSRSPSALPSGNNRRGDYRHNERETRALNGVQVSQPEKQRRQDKRH